MDQLNDEYIPNKNIYLLLPDLRRFNVNNLSV